MGADGQTGTRSGRYRANATGGSSWTTARHARPRHRRSTTHGSCRSGSSGRPTSPTAVPRWPSVWHRSPTGRTRWRSATAWACRRSGASRARSPPRSGTDVDVRRTGRISTLADDPAKVRPRPPVITAHALGETGRTRPLRPGVSIAHAKVTAGTLGAFVHKDGVVHALSNFHVLAGSPQAKVGDTILQPGPADGGRAPRDRVGTLAAWVDLDQRPHGHASTARSPSWTTRRSTRSTRWAGSPPRPSRSAVSRWPRSAAPRRSRAGG